MKILILILGLFVLAQVSAQENHTTTYQVNYGLTYKIDSLHRDERDVKNCYLYAGPGFGVFTFYNYIEHQEEVEKRKEKYGGDVNTEFNYTMYFGNLRLNKTFYKNLQTGKVTTVAKIGQKKYKFEEPKRSFNWKMKDSTKIDHGHSVQKATTHFAGRDYVAWFASDIPLRDGPYLFSGLPGLIVELYDIKKDYVFKLKSIKKLEKSISWSIPKDAETTTKKNYRKLEKNFIETIYLSSDANYIMSHTPGVNGGIIVDENGKVTETDLKLHGKQLSLAKLRRLYKKNLKRQNNPIELK